METIDRLTDVRYRTLVENYLKRDAPAIITDAMDSWSVMNTDYFWFDNITHVSTMVAIAAVYYLPGGTTMFNFFRTSPERLQTISCTLNNATDTYFFCTNSFIWKTNV